MSYKLMDEECETTYSFMYVRSRTKESLMTLIGYYESTAFSPSKSSISNLKNNEPNGSLASLALLIPHAQLFA